MKTKILSSAIDDLMNGYKFYEKQSEGVGEYFLDSLFSDIDSLVINAGIHPIYYEKYHRMLSKRFPFAIYYKVEGQVAVVYAVLDCRRNPAWLRKKLKK
jgi:hypothetical protein